MEGTQRPQTPQTSAPASLRPRRRPCLAPASAAPHWFSRATRLRKRPRGLHRFNTTQTRRESQHEAPLPPGQRSLSPALDVARYGVRVTGTRAHEGGPGPGAMRVHGSQDTWDRGNTARATPHISACTCAQARPRERGGARGPVPGCVPVVVEA